MTTRGATRLSKVLSVNTSTSPLSHSFRRNLITSQHPYVIRSLRRALPEPFFARSVLQQSFRRSYADAVSPVTKKRGRRFFRWTWRVTYLSLLGGIGALGYQIYLLRTPDEQFDPDPSKKTLVILGKLPYSFELHSIDLFRDRLGLRLTPQEARHGKLQCHCHLTQKLLPLHSSTAIMYYRHDRTPLYHGAHPKHPKTQES